MLDQHASAPDTLTRALRHLDDAYSAAQAADDALLADDTSRNRRRAQHADRLLDDATDRVAELAGDGVEPAFEAWTLDRVDAWLAAQARHERARRREATLRRIRELEAQGAYADTDELAELRQLHHRLAPVRTERRTPGARTSSRSREHSSRPRRSSSSSSSSGDPSPGDPEPEGVQQAHGACRTGTQQDAAQQHDGRRDGFRQRPTTRPPLQAVTHAARSHGDKLMESVAGRSRASSDAARTVVA